MDSPRSYNPSSVTTYGLDKSKSNPSDGDGFDLWESIRNGNMNVVRYLDILGMVYFKSENLSPNDRNIVLDEIERAFLMKTGDPEYALHQRKRFMEFCHPPYKPEKQEVK